MATRFLLCSPDHFDVTFDRAPSTATGRSPDPEASWDEWWHLVAGLRELGAQVDHYPSTRGVPDMVFPTHAAVVDGDCFLRERPLCPELRDRSERGAAWLLRNGFTELSWPDDPDVYLEGGDAAGFGGVLVCGTGFRTSAGAAAHAGAALGVEVVTVPLVDPRLHRLDMSFLPLDGRRAICAPDAWSAEGRRAIERLVPERLVITAEEALTLCTNSVVVGDTVVMPSCPPRLADALRAWGFDVRVSPVDEFLGAGGGIRRMALDLDMLARPVQAVAR